MERFPNKKLPRIETLYAEQSLLISERNSLNKEYKKVVAELEKLDYARQTINEYLDTEQKKVQKKGLE